jgi:hypothetical protein
MTEYHENRFRYDYIRALSILVDEGGSLFHILEQRFGWIIKRKEVDNK